MKVEKKSELIGRGGLRLYRRPVVGTGAGPWAAAQAAGAAGESLPRKCFSHAKFEISRKFEKSPRE
jgi:hypothetical protein